MLTFRQLLCERQRRCFALILVHTIMCMQLVKALLS